MVYLDPGAGAIREARTNAGAPGAGTTEVQTIATTGVPTGGTFRLAYKSQVTSALAYNAAAATIQAALEALASIGAGGVVCAAGPLPTGVTVTFSGTRHEKKAVPLISLFENALTGGTTPVVTFVETTPGVDATHRGAPKGARVTDTTNGKEYINTGTATAPIWTVVGAQT